MGSRPHHDTASILLDARHLLGIARAACNDAKFAERIDQAELDAYEAEINQLAKGSGQTRNAFHNKVAAGVNVAKARAVVFGIIGDVRKDARALEGADQAHVEAGTTRHSDALTTAVLMHDVRAETARIRLTALRLYHGDQAKLDAFAPTLPRYAITPKVPVLTPPATPSPTPAS
jgi:hypothetical protein